MRHTIDFSSVPAVFNQTSLRLFGASRIFLQRCVDTSARTLRVWLTLLAAFLFFTPATAQNASAQDQNSSLFGLPSPQHLFGDWGGERTALAEKGLTFDFFYISDMETNPAGGLEQAQAGWMRIRGTMDPSFDRLISWQGWN
jgi:porin